MSFHVLDYFIYFKSVHEMTKKVNARYVERLLSFGASHPLIGSLYGLPTFFSSSAAENGIPGGLTQCTKSCIGLVFL